MYIRLDSKGKIMCVHLEITPYVNYLQQVLCLEWLFTQIEGRTTYTVFSKENLVY